MDVVSNDRRRLVISVYEQHWRQIRHVQRERFWLVVIFSSVIAAVLVVMHGNLFVTASWPVVVFLMAQSLLGLFVSIKIQIALRAHLGAAEYILSRYGLKHYLPRYRPTFTSRLMRISRMIPMFFLFCFCFLLWVFVYALTNTWWWPAVIAAVIYLVSAATVYFSRYDEPAPIERD